MLTSTIINATQSVILREPIVPPEARSRRLDAPRRAGAGASSPAGLHRRPWLGRLRHALQEELFVLHFQPIVSLRDGLVSHHEALVRLADDPGGGLVAPGLFLPAAERYGLVRDLDRMVLERVAALLGTEPETRIAVNVSALSVTDGSMLAHIERSLDAHGVDPARLVIEITETAAITDMARARAFCEGVLALGCPLSLDDFGAGYGSFQYLKQLPFTHLKIDGDFIRLLPVSRTDQLVVRALASVVRGMGRETIAEFVGDGATVSLLRSYGVDYAQGFQVGHPTARSPAAV